jgi:DNA repair protein RadC
MNCKIDSEVPAVCEVKISYRPKVKPSERPCLMSSADIFKFLKENGVFHPDTIELRESFKVMLLNSANRLLGIAHLSEGGVSRTEVDMRHVMQAAILANAAGIVLCHNHPSGNVQPGTADDRMTERVKAASEIFDIRVLDHIVLSSEGYYSYADEGRIL